MIAALALAGTLYGVSALVDSVSTSPDTNWIDTAEPKCSSPIEIPGKLPKTLLVDAQAQAFAIDLLGRHPAVLSVVVGLDMRTARPLFLVAQSNSRCGYRHRTRSRQWPGRSLSQPAHRAGQ